ncbi:hypothetical protein B0A49_04587 [Cryomyces minteri]|uniref:PQ-loop repeat-containing protein 1 n=1 Tax=Cryomyces minteri TaxID=331657 RepID=A0A4U0XBA2_9PEZI|nr:hypothetical protein B0A49_04587 [Cryomyces minteri]
MAFFKWLITHISPVFLVTSPVTSYADQIYSIHKSRSSAGFSLDIPLIMLVASILKIYYWFGARYDMSLLVQATIMIVVQLLLLHVALTYRPAKAAATTLHTPFAGSREGGTHIVRPWNFWQWRSARPYWQFLTYYFIALGGLQVFLGSNPFYIALQGYTALGIEATLPLPQILSNRQNRSCKGFRFSVLVNWLIGDVMKMCFFFLADTEVPWSFKLCGLFQFACDMYLGVQYWQYGEGEGSVDGWAGGKDDVRLA